MAISYSNLPSLTFPSPIPKNQFPFPIKYLSTKPPKRRRFEIRFSTSKSNEFRVREPVETRVGLVLPGGSWWSLGEDDDGNVESSTKSAPAKPITAVFALRRMWELISGDGRWAIFVGFGALVIAALSEISIPSVLTASIFSAQNGETVVFCRNSQFLLILCVTSGICSGLRSCCFAIANMILVMRLRETLYSSILFQVAQETLSLMRTVRIYGTERKELGRYKQWLDKLAFVNIRESVAYGLWNMSFNTLYRSTQVIALLLGGMSILSGHVSPEQLTKYVLYCEWLIYATWRVTDNLSSLLQSVGASEKVFQLIDLLPSDQFLSKGVKLQKVMGHIQFVNVTFHYPSRLTVPILEHVNFSVKANEVVAIVGISGSGKSTLVNLLLRLYEPSSGQIYIDGFPLRELDIRWLREKVGFVGQEPHLFHMDIKSNIRYGCSRHIEQKDIEWAAKQAYANEFISSLPDGYETVVDDNLLSGGQKQRIAIARAILRDPAILILDEATSALDSESEHYVKGVIRAMGNDVKAKRTVIVIAHRLSTIKAADRIIVLDSGRVVEMGDNTELLLKDGLYAHLFKIQTDALA
ncbi:ABC transporter B family member 26, chloroplastic-like isoform X3 [Castanea sativa]|uniref:ABC transporter B family member 26, chloroplastic-like isoform X3 n=1 Tax=Castanea sativa TaxID=21020 RepID=UPI003F6510EB